MNRTTIFSAAVIAGLAGVAAWYTTTNVTAKNTTTAPLLVAQATTTTDATPDNAMEAAPIVEMTLGNPDARVHIIEYASFTCPHCANFHNDQFAKIKSEYVGAGDVQFTFREVYFDRFGLWASMVARCDGATRFFGVLDVLFADQEKWIGDGDPVMISANLRKIGKLAGMSDETVGACMEDATKAKSLITWFETNAAKDEIQSTPTLIINGEKYSNMSYDDLKAVIDTKLAE